MIPKFICWLFGHRFTWKEYAKNEYDYVIHKEDYCGRCGKDLRGKQP